MNNIKVNKNRLVNKKQNNPSLTSRIRTALITGCKLDSHAQIILKQTQNGVLGVVKSQTFRNMPVSVRQNKINQSLKKNLYPDDLKKITVILTHAL